MSPKINLTGAAGKINHLRIPPICEYVKSIFRIKTIIIKPSYSTIDSLFFTGFAINGYFPSKFGKFFREINDCLLGSSQECFDGFIEPVRSPWSELFS